MAWRRGAALLGLLAFGLAGCSSTVDLYHRAEGGAIALKRQPPPGADQPYPNLASVPAAPVAPTASRQLATKQPEAGNPPDVYGPSPGALAGLELPTAPPPLPHVPGLMIPAAPATPVASPPPPVAAKSVPPDSAPVALSFAPGSALLNKDNATALRGLAAAQLGAAGASLLVAGFGEAAAPGDSQALNLALARAQRLANGLTAAGTPSEAIKLVAAAAGSGGFVQLVY